MKLPSIKKHRVNTNTVRQKLSHVLSQTRRRTSKVVKFWKHMGQILRERVPVISPLQEIIAGKSLISDIHVIKYSMARW